MKNRRKWWIFLTLIAVLLLAGCGNPTGGQSGEQTGGSTGGQSGEQASGNTGGQTGGSAGGESSEPIRIGAVFSSSGSAAPLGKPEMDTMNMLVEKVNQAGGIGGRKIELYAYDDQSDQNKALINLKRLVDQHKVVAVIGGTISGNSLAMIPQVEKMQIPYISVAASKDINDPSKGPRHWTFKTAQGDDVIVPRVLQYLKDNGYTKIAWLYVDNAFGSSAHSVFEALAAEYGVEAVIEETFEATVNDATAMLTRVQREKPQAVVVWGTAQESAVVTKNIRDLGIDVPIINSHGIATRQFIELAGEAAKGVIFPAGRLLVADQLPDDHPQKQILLEYSREFKEQFGYEASTFGGHVWDAFYMLVKAIEAVGDDPAKIRDYLENQTKGFVGTGGIFTMSPDNHNGLSPDSVVMIQIGQNGEWTLLQD